MISHGKNVKVFSANANKSLAEGICRKLWLPLGDSTVTSFADGEVSMTINESVRGSDVFLVQPTCKPVNDHLMELLLSLIHIYRQTFSTGESFSFRARRPGAGVRSVRQARPTRP